MVVNFIYLLDYFDIEASGGSSGMPVPPTRVAGTSTLSSVVPLHSHVMSIAVDSRRLSGAAPASVGGSNMAPVI